MIRSRVIGKSQRWMCRNVWFDFIEAPSYHKIILLSYATGGTRGLEGAMVPPKLQSDPFVFLKCKTIFTHGPIRIFFHNGPPIAWILVPPLHTALCFDFMSSILLENTVNSQATSNGRKYSVLSELNMTKLTKKKAT